MLLVNKIPHFIYVMVNENNIKISVILNYGFVVAK